MTLAESSKLISHSKNPTPTNDFGFPIVEKNDGPKSELEVWRELISKRWALTIKKPAARKGSGPRLTQQALFENFLIFGTDWTEVTHKDHSTGRNHEVDPKI